MANLGKEKTIEQIKKEIANLTPEQRAQKLKEAKEKQNRNKQSVFADENTFSELVKVVVHEDFDYYEQKNDVNLSRVVKFEKNADFAYEQDDLIDMPFLEVVQGNANFEGCNVKTLKNLKNVGGDAWFDNSKIQSLPNLTSVGNCLVITDTQLTSLPNLTKVGDYADFNHSNIKELPKLKTVGGVANFCSTTIEELPELTTIGDYALFLNSKIKNLPKLESVGFMDFDEGVELPLMPKLKQCEHIKIGDIIFKFEEFRRLEDKIRASKGLKEVFNGMAISTDSIYVDDNFEAEITDQFDGVVEWKNLSRVDLETASAWYNTINKLTSLKKVIGNINLKFCENLRELPNLEKVQGMLIIDFSSITELPKLVEAEGVQCSCGKNGIPQMPKLTKCKKIIIRLQEKDAESIYWYPKFEFSFNDFKKYETEIRKCRTSKEFKDIEDKILSKELERL